jgi:AraC family transcriptional regulator
MPAAPVPVTLGSPRFRTVSVRGCDVVHAWFPPNSSIETHTHEHATLALMLNGSFELDFKRQSFSCTPTSVAVEPAGERHANVIGSQGAEVLVLQPSPSQTELWRPFSALFESVSYFRHGGIAGLGSRIVSEIDAPDAFSSLAIEGLLLDVLVAAGRVFPDSKRHALPSWLSRVQEMLHEEPTARLSVTALAQAAGVHPAYLARAFRRFFHCSVGAYARRIRVEKAAGRLALGSDSIATIAIEAGFADQSHLTRCFKRMYETTPRSFREAHRYRSALGNDTRASVNQGHSLLQPCPSDE